MSANQKVALITGGNRGIGKSITQALMKARYLTAVACNKCVGSGNFDLFIEYDLSEYGKDRNPVEMTLKHYGRIDVLINNAGGQYFSPFQEYNIDEWNNQIALMLTAPFRISQKASKHMTDGGHIINILSTASFQGARNIVGYVAAKHGLLGLTRAMAIELAPDIHVNAVAPGITETDMIADMTPERRDLLESITPAGRFNTPEEIANAVMFLVNSTGIYGQVITVDNGWMVKNG